MQSKFKVVFSVISLILLIAVSSLLPLFSFEGYSILHNTTSHLGAQGSPNAWIMNLVFITLGIRTLFVVFSSHVTYIKFFGFLFGVSLVFTGIFRHSPLIDSMIVDKFQDMMHSVFATITGFSFTLLTAGHAFMSSGKQRVMAIIMFAISTISSLMMMSLPSVMGISQRFMFLTAFIWLFFLFKPISFNKIKV